MATTNPNAPGSPAGSATYNSQVPQGSPNAFTRLQYVKAVLAQGGWKDTPDNEQFLLNLAQREHAVQDTSDPSAAFNLFDSEKPEPNSSFFNHTSASAGVQNYPDFQTGVAAAVATLKQGYYKNIQAALAQGNAATQDAAGKFTADLSSWSGGGYTTVSDANGKDAPISATGRSDQGSGVAGVDGSTGATTGPSGTTGDIDGFLQSQARELAAQLADPQVKSLLQQWGAGALSDPEFQAQLEKTKWWKTTPLSARQALVQNATDPASAAQALKAQADAVSVQAQRMGVTLDANTVNQLASQSISQGWTTQQLTEQVAAHLTSTGQAKGGEAATDLDSLNALYKSYQVPVTTQTLNQQLQQMLAGTQTLNGLTSSVAQQAQKLYANNPQLAASIDDKTSTMDAIQPLIAQASNLLGVDPGTIDPSNAKWSFLLKPTTDPTTGKSTGNQLTLDDLNRQIQLNPVFEFSKTQNGIASYQGMADALEKAFGGGSVS